MVHLLWVWHQVAGFGLAMEADLCIHYPTNPRLLEAFHLRTANRLESSAPARCSPPHHPPAKAFKTAIQRTKTRPVLDKTTANVPFSRVPPRDMTWPKGP